MPEGANYLDSRKHNTWIRRYLNAGSASETLANIYTLGPFFGNKTCYVDGS